MKKITFLLLLTGIVCNFNAQNILIEYNVQNLDRNINGILIANKKESLYSTNSLQTYNNDTITQISDNEITVKPRISQIPKKKYYSKSNSNAILYVIIPNNKKSIVVRDSIPKLEWYISPTASKNILGYECNKATTLFRGSEIVCYFTPEIPLSYGPFKFKGLPGIILEVYNINSPNIHKWTATKIIYPYESEYQVNFEESEYNTSEIISYKELKDRIDGNIRVRSSQIISTAPRGTSVKVTNTRRLGIEQVYEWEK